MQIQYNSYSSYLFSRNQGKPIKDTVFFGTRSAQERIKSSTGTDIIIRPLSLPPRPDKIVLFLPGLNINEAKCENLFSTTLINEKCAVYGLDRSYVQSDGPKLDCCKNLFIQAAEAVNHIKEKHNKPVHIVGYSLGGAVAAQVAVDSSLNENVASVLLFSPTILDKESTELAKRGMPKDINGELPQFWEELTHVSDGLVENAGKIKVPTVVVSGDKQPNFYIEYLNIFMKNIKNPNKELIILKGEGHQLSSNVLDEQGSIHLK